MKYVVAWKPRSGGSAAENEAAVARLLEVFSKWTRPATSRSTSSSPGSTGKAALRSPKATTLPPVVVEYSAAGLDLGLWRRHDRLACLLRWLTGCW
jgi:hypothetical protein